MSNNKPLDQDFFTEKHAQQRLNDARNVEFLDNFKNFKKGETSIMHFSIAEKLAERYPKKVKVSEINKESELSKAKKVAGIED